MTVTISDVIAKVLIIEDNTRYAEKLKRAFETNERGLQFDVKIVGSASEAEPLIEENQTDIYVVDLELPEFNAAPSERIGEILVKEIVRRADGGVIVHTGILRRNREDFLWGGVDDFILKGDSISHVIAKAFAVWRRVQDARKPTNYKKPANKTYRVGKWRFEKGSRILLSEDGQSVRLSPTELAFIQYLCTVDAEIDRREFNVAVLGRPAYEEDKRIDNLVYRLREKLGDSFQIVPRHNDGIYKLIDFEELPNK